MGIILVYGVIGVYNGGSQPVGQAVGHPEGAELALGMDHIGSPADQLPEEAPGPVDPQPGAGINLVGADGPHIIDVSILIAVHRVGQGNHPDLVALPLQLPLQQQDRGDHAVDDRRVPIRCNQYFHISPL